MNTDEMRAHRMRYNERMSETDAFFREFGVLDDRTYEDGSISEKHKELYGVYDLRDDLLLRSSAA